MAHVTQHDKHIRITGSLDEMVWRGRHSSNLGGLSDRERDLQASMEVDAETTRWTMTQSFAEAARLAMDGWTEGAKRLSDLRDELMDKVGELLPEDTYIMDVSGFDVDVGAYLAGEPECMVTHTQQPGRNRHIHVMVNIATKASATPNSMMMRGLMAAGVVDALESMGHTVTLDVVNLLYGVGDYKMTHITTVKRASEVLDLERVVFACAHPSMLRRLTFGVMESLNQSQRSSMRVFTGYGSPSDDPTEFFTSSEMPDVYIGNAQGSETLADVADHVINYLRDAGVIDNT